MEAGTDIPITLLIPVCAPTRPLVCLPAAQRQLYDTSGVRKFPAECGAHTVSRRAAERLQQPEAKWPSPTERVSRMLAGRPAGAQVASVLAWSWQGCRAG